MTYQYSGDELIEKTAIDLFHSKRGWVIAYANNTETFGQDSSLGRHSKNEFILKRFFLQALRDDRQHLNEGVKLFVSFSEFCNFEKILDKKVRYLVTSGYHLIAEEIRLFTFYL